MATFASARVAVSYGNVHCFVISCLKRNQLYVFDPLSPAFVRNFSRVYICKRLFDCGLGCFQKSFKGDSGQSQRFEQRIDRFSKERIIRGQKDSTMKYDYIVTLKKMGHR